MGSGNRFKPLTEQAGAPSDPFEEVFVRDDAEHGSADCAGERIPAVGRPMRSRRHTCRRFGFRQACAERKPAPDPFGDGHDIRLDSRQFVREQFAGPPHAALDFVQNQQGSFFVAKCPQSLHVRVGERDDPAFADDRFHHDRRRELVDGGLRGLNIFGINPLEARRQGREAGHELLGTRGRDHCEGPSVK